MKHMIKVLSLICTFLRMYYCFMDAYPKVKELPIAPDPDPGEALYLTPLIEAGKIIEAQNKSLNRYNGFKNVKSYSGYLTVNKQYNSNLFFWYFPSETNPEHAPVILWLQGGPGASTLIYGLFLEHGPFIVSEKFHIKLRHYSWIKNHHIIYVDNPVGTGYSFTNDENGYVRNETQLGNDLYTALMQFFQLFPELQKNEFFVSGESYAGKYVPAISYTIHKNNPEAKLKINLKGLSMGDGLSDPEHQLTYSEFLYQISLIDTNTRIQFKSNQDQGIKLIKEEQWILALLQFDVLMNSFTNVTGGISLYNYLNANDSDNTTNNLGEFLQRNDIRAAIHVGRNQFNGDATSTKLYLMADMMQSVAPWVSELLNHYRVLIYNGQLDIVVAYPLTVNYLKHLNFSAAEEYKTAARNLWYVEDELAGYSKTAGNLTEVLVRNAGHMVPADQPKWAFDLITRFTRNKPIV